MNIINKINIFSYIAKDNNYKSDSSIYILQANMSVW